MTAIRYPVTEPHLDDNDRAHLLDAFDSGWISSQGPYLQSFERAFAEFAHAARCAAGINNPDLRHGVFLVGNALQRGAMRMAPSRRTSSPLK
jgi:dTDP-4-amino-4,6-dideoxygalactose transaminase